MCTMCVHVSPGCPSMLAKRMSELMVGYISIHADMECSWPWSCNSSRNFYTVYTGKECGENSHTIYVCKESTAIRSNQIIFAIFLNYIYIFQKENNYGNLRNEDQYVVCVGYLERLPVFALSASLSQKRFLFLLFFFLFQSTDVLLEADQCILLIHVYHRHK